MPAIIDATRPDAKPLASEEHLEHEGPDGKEGAGEQEEFETRLDDEGREQGRASDRPGRHPDQEEDPDGEPDRRGWPRTSQEEFVAGLIDPDSTFQRLD